MHEEPIFILDRIGLDRRGRHDRIGLEVKALTEQEIKICIFTKN